MAAGDGRHAYPRGTGMQESPDLYGERNTTLDSRAVCQEEVSNL